MNPCMSRPGRACLRLRAFIGSIRVWMWPAVAGAALCATLTPTPASALAPQYYFFDGLPGHDRAPWHGVHSR